MDVREEEIAELIVAARGGEAEAFCRLTGRFEDLAFGQAMAILRDFHKAQDVTQEALVAAYLNLPSLRQPEAFGNWLAGIVRHCCHRMLRRRDLEWVPIESEVDLIFDSPSDERAQVNELRETVLAAVGELPDPQRDVVRLYYLRGCSQLEVGAFLKLPLTTVNNRLNAARALLKKRIIKMTATKAAEANKYDVVMNVGVIAQIDGPVIDARFEPAATPDIFDALVVADSGGRFASA